MMRPDVFPAVVAMSVPHRRRRAARALDTLRKAGKSDFYYLYFQEQAARTNSRSTRRSPAAPVPYRLGRKRRASRR